MKEIINKTDIIPCDNPSGIVCFDTETTGIYTYNNEILQVSFVDGEGNVLLNSLVKPVNRKQWPDAQKINGISPKMVKDAPTLADLAPAIRGILASAKVLVAYNMDFDVSFLKAANLNFGLYIHPETKIDVMIDYAEVAGKWNDYHGDYKWQKLVDCANHYGFDWSTTGTHAHDSLGDALATLYCYPLVRKDLEEKRERIKKYQRELAHKEIQRHENNIKYLNDNAQYFNKRFIKDFLNIAESRKADLSSVKHSCNYVKPITVFIISCLGGSLAIDRFYLAFKMLKSNIRGMSVIHALFACLKVLYMILAIITKFFVYIFLFVYIWDIVFSFKHAKKTNEQFLVMDADLCYGNLFNYTGKW